MCKNCVIFLLATVYVVEIKSKGKVVDLSCNFDNDLCYWYQDENTDFNWTVTSGENDSSTSGLPKDQTVGGKYWCTFEHNACSWELGFQWKRMTGHIESDKTFPKFDHTLQSKDGHYAYLDENGTIAVMRSPTVSDGIYCFSFWYYMNGDGSMNLQVLLNEKGLDQTPEELFSTSENQGDEWRHVEIQINSKHTFSLVLIGTRKNNSDGGIAVDDIVLRIFSNQCKTGNGSLVVIAVTTSCIAAIILAICFFIIWRRTHGARKKKSTAVENKMYPITSTIHFENRSAVNEHLQHNNANSDIDVQDSSSDYTYIDLNTVPMNGKEAYGHQKVTKHSDNLDCSHSQCSKQKTSTETDNTHNPTNELNYKRMMKEEEDPTYDHTVKKTKKGNYCTEYEYSYVERTTGEKDSYMQAVAGSEVLGGNPQSQKSYDPGETDKPHFILEKQDGQTEMEMLPDKSLEYFILEKTEPQQS